MSLLVIIPVGGLEILDFKTRLPNSIIIYKDNYTIKILIDLVAKFLGL